MTLTVTALPCLSDNYTWLLRAAGKATVPTTIGQELATNPFLRAPDVATLARIRTAKDNFR